jgi:hypothetical protein
VLDDEHVLVLVGLRGAASAAEHPSGSSAQREQLFYVRDSRVRKFVHYSDRERALADLGLARRAS